MANGDTQNGGYVYVPPMKRSRLKNAGTRQRSSRKACVNAAHSGDEWSPFPRYKVATFFSA